MSVLKIVKCKGVDKDDAFKNLNFDPNCKAIPGRNVTYAWKQAGSPALNSKKFIEFITGQLQKKTKNTPGLGVHLSMESWFKDNKIRPYKIYNCKTEGARCWIMKYQICEDEIVEGEIPNYKEDINGELVEDFKTKDIQVTSNGKIIMECDTKQDALTNAKKLTTLTHKNYSIKVVKVPDHTRIAAYCMYSPSIRTTEGTWVAAGFPFEEDDKLHIIETE